MRKTVVELEVYFSDCDPTGFAHSSKHFQWFEQGRITLLKEANIDSSFVSDYHFMTIDSYCKYKSSVRFGDKLIIEATINEKDISRILEFNYKITKKLGKKLVATGNTRHVLTTINGQLLQRIPVSIREKLNLYIEGE
ncbi:acyl-CoA thioesterase [Metabacillus malikii]|uniref:Acyl-CoA thioester hydrolase n=1 Tax=Metabacillus malikii TaxID=1504265 RepID=A0ABT9Z9Z6_9BACI|nr:thioesterase family protein [Metabacillus malikii]MDQ0229073.1 acyl-CoA thioester hydrolase [Metabacillus malikii]